MSRINMSISEYAETWEALFPDAGDRLAIFSPLVDSISYCKRHGSEAWSVTQKETGFRLNVGPVEAMTFGWYEVKAGTYDLEYDTSYETLRLLVVGSSCTEKVTKSYCSDISEISYPVIGQPSWCYIGTFGQALADGYDPSRDEVSGYLKALWTHHEEFLNCAFRTPTGKIRQRSNYAQHNNPAIYEYALSVVDGKIWSPTSQDELNEKRIAVNPAVDQSLKDSA